ncbi:GPI-GlcNAc transferase complex, PIG-H component-domain-containing protein [Hypoxylon argillaceum]|nr:GPI-GlcNAc transferase complex, PIG-H component-domain-containing protein [Hypoxylon argillaceum]
MLTTAPYLRIRRPSPTAAEFTVSTLPPLTPALRLTLYTIYLLQGLLSLTILLVLYVAWTGSPYAPSSSPVSGAQPPSHLEQALHALLASGPGVKIVALAQGTSPRILVPACGAALWALTRRLHAEESLLVLRGLGIQTRSSRGSILPSAASTTRFIPTAKIRDVLINEAFLGFEVRHYLVVVVDGEPDVVVVFPKLLPRRRVVEKVWRGVRECLYLRTAGDGTVNGDGGLGGGS